MQPSRVESTGGEGPVCITSEQRQGRERRGRCGCEFTQLQMSKSLMGVSKSQNRAAVQELLPGSGTTWVGVKAEQLCAPGCASAKASAPFAPG